MDKYYYYIRNIIVLFYQVEVYRIIFNNNHFNKNIYILKHDFQIYLTSHIQCILDFVVSEYYYYLG